MAPDARSGRVSEDRSVRGRAVPATSEDLAGRRRAVQELVPGALSGAFGAPRGGLTCRAWLKMTVCWSAGGFHRDATQEQARQDPASWRAET